MYFIAKGLKVQKGEFQGRPYHNVLLFGHDEKGVWDLKKIKAKILYEAGFDPDKKGDWSLLIDNKITILYNQYGNVEYVEIAG